MTDRRKTFKRLRRYLAFAALVLTLGAILTGCQSVSYYKQAVQGQYEIWTARRAIPALLADTNTPEALKEKLQLVLKMREFAERELKLPVNGHYSRYADLKRRFVVWNVHAAPELSLKPRTWWYPVVGSLKYRGYFSEAHARAYAKGLEKKGWDVYVGGVEAYSTLGWFKDPVLNTFIHHNETDLAEILFHELAHQRVFASGDTDFNEAFATAVAEEAVQRWFRATGNASALQSYRVELGRHDEFVRLVMQARQELEALYGSEASLGKPAANGSNERDKMELRREKERILSRLREGHEQLKASWGGYAGYDKWFRGPLNNAQLNTIATYYHLVPAFHHLLEQNDRDLEKFYQQVSRLSELRKEERHRQLEMALKNAKGAS